MSEWHEKQQQQQQQQQQGGFILALGRDVEWLKSHGLIDYSLLVGFADLGALEVDGVKLCCLSGVVRGDKILGVAVRDKVPALIEGPGSSSVIRSPAALVLSFVAAVAEVGAVPLGVGGATPPAEDTPCETSGSPPAEPTDVGGWLVP